MLLSRNLEYAKACERLAAKVEDLPARKGCSSCGDCLFRARVELSDNHTDEEKSRMLDGCGGMESEADLTTDPSMYCPAARDFQLALGIARRAIDDRLVERVPDFAHIEGAVQVEHMFFLGGRRVFASRETPLGSQPAPILDSRTYQDGTTGEPLTSQQVYTSEAMLAKIVP